MILKDLPLTDHLDELRFRLIPAIVALFIFFFIGLLFSAPILSKVNNDLLTANVNLISVTPLEFIYTKIKVAFLFSVFITIPIIIYHALMFTKPALTKKEKKAIMLILPSFTLLFLIGASFAYFIFLKVAIYFLAKLSTGIALNMWSINKFITFVFVTCISFGLVFQLPLFLLVLNKLNIVSIKTLRTKRKYVYVMAFLTAALITPPDVITQVLIAIPLILLYEVSVLIVRVFN